MDKEIIIKSLDNKVSFSLGKYKAKVENYFDELTNIHKIEFQSKEEKEEFKINEINNSSFVVKDSYLKVDDRLYNKYLDVKGYRFLVTEGSADNVIYIEGVGLQEYSLFSMYEFIPFFCFYTLDSKEIVDTGASLYQCTYDSINEMFTENKITDYYSFKNEMKVVSEKLLFFDDNNQSFIIKTITFPKMKKQDRNSALNIKCYNDYFEISRIEL